LARTSTFLKVAKSSTFDNTGCGVGVPQSPVLARSQSLPFGGDSNSGPCLFHIDFLCNSFAVYLTFVQFILHQKYCLYTILYLLVEELKISVKSSLTT